MLDRLDRLVLAAEARADASAPAAPRDELAGVPARPAAPALPGVSIFTPRGPRFVDHMPCPMCGYRNGIAYHGELMSGAKVHTLAAHSPARAVVMRGAPRCLGAGMRVEFVGDWRGVRS